MNGCYGNCQQGRRPCDCRPISDGNTKSNVMISLIIIVFAIVCAVGGLYHA